MTFFSPGTWNRKQPLSLVPMCGTCRLWESCNSPKMPVTGEGRKRVLIVGEAPGENEDNKGKQFIGNAGMELARILHSIGVNMRKDCWLTNAVICRSHDDEGNRTPTDKEVNYCRANLANTLKSLQPDVVIPMGGVACKSLIPLAWKDGEVDEVTRWVGWHIPSRKLNCWICPTYHPSFLLHAKDTVAELHVTRHLRAAFKHKSKPYKEVPDFSKKVVVCFDPIKAASLVYQLGESGVVAFDFETTTLKPDGPHAEIICCSVSDGTISIAYPWQGVAIEATRELLTDPKVGKTGWNIQFEDRWVRTKLGCTVKSWIHDGMLASHWLDCRYGVNSLKFQAFVHLGMEDYDSQLALYMQAKDSNSPNRLREVEPRTLLQYCALDALLEFKMYEVQTKLGGLLC